MTPTPTRKSASPCRTICLPITEEEYEEIIGDPAKFRQWLEQTHQQSPELFPDAFAQGFQMHSQRLSTKQQLTIRRIQLRDGTCWSIRPSFVTPYMSGGAEDVENALFLRKFSVPYWALAHVFGRNAMYYYRLETALGRNSIVGTTVRRGKLPEHLLADEHHQKQNGNKVFIATTVGDGCFLGAEASPSSGAEELTEA